MTGNGLASQYGHDLAVGEAEIEETAAEIRRYAGRAMLEFASTVGRIVLERFYRGDVAAFHAHGRKDGSLRRLAERLDDDLHLSASGLSRCVGIHVVLEELGPLSRWQHLTPTHVRTVLALPAPERARVLAEADAQGWSVRQLEQAIQVERASPPDERREAEAFVRAMKRYDAELGPDGRLATGVRHVAVLSLEEIEDTYATVQRVRENLEKLHREMSLKRLGVMNARRRARHVAEGHAPVRSRAIGRA
jgi:hypothetical protein